MIYPEELQLSEENTDKPEASFLDLDIKIEDGKFHFVLFGKRYSFPFSIVRMPDKSSNILSSIVYSTIAAQSLRIARENKTRNLSPQQLNHLFLIWAGSEYPLEYKELFFKVFLTNFK